MLREGRFVIPTKDNSGKSTLAIVNKAITEAVNRFGGATAYEIGGFWTDSNGLLYRDAGMAIDVAYEPSLANDQAFAAIATRAAIQAEQESVYIRLASGEVSIPNVKPQPVEVAA